MSVIYAEESGLAVTLALKMVIPSIRDAHFSSCASPCQLLKKARLDNNFLIQTLTL
jgi:hypothetical protein